MKRWAMERLVAWKDQPKRKPLIVRGARQVGKTYLLKKFGRQYFARTHYLNFEQDERLHNIFKGNLSPQRLLTEIQFYLNKPIHPKSDLLIFDEIQHCPEALTTLKYFQEEMPELAICAAGSLLGVVLAPTSFPVGKVTFLDLYPLNFEEFLEGLGQQSLVRLLLDWDLSSPLPQMAHENLWQFWKRYLITGGLPEVVNIFRERQKNEFLAHRAVRQIQQDLIAAYLMDIAKHSGKIAALNIERLWRNVPNQLANTQDGSAPKFRFKGILPGVRGYERIATPLAWLEKARLVLRTSIVPRAESPLAAFTKENRFKLYFFDVGLLGSLSGLEPYSILQYDYGTYKGYVAENFVAQELTSAGAPALFCWQGRTAEIEFLLETTRGIVPLEVKSGWVTKSKSLKVYEERYNPPLSVILSAENMKVTPSRLKVPLYAIAALVRKLKQSCS